MTIPARDERLHQLLLLAESGRIARRTGWVLLDYGPANLSETLGVSTLDQLGWLIWTNPDHALVESCCLSRAGITVLLAWRRELWGTVEDVLSERPLSACCCTDGDLGLSPTVLAAFRAAFAALDQEGRR